MYIGGLASGLDINGIMEQLMAVERRPIVNIQNKQQELQAQKNAWRDINTRMRSLADKFLSLKLESTYVSRLAKSSNEDILKASASSTAVEGNYPVNITRLATAATFYSEKQVTGVDDLLGEGRLEMELGDEAKTTVAIDIDGEMSLRSLVKHINELKLGEEEAQTLPIRASIVDNRLVLASKETGAESSFSVSMTGTVLDAGVKDFTQVADSGLDAELEVNGITVTSSSNTLKDVIQGVTLDLLEVGKTTLTVSQDTQQVVDRLQEFVDQYNSVIIFVNDKLQAQSAMDSNSVRGTLSGDGTLMRLQGSLRNMVVGGAGGEGKFRSLADIGIGTAKYVPGAADYSGKLILDKAKLEETLLNDPLAVKNLLFKTTTEPDENGDMVTRNSGLFHDLETYVRDFTRAGDGILTEKDKAYDKQIGDLKLQAEKMEQRLEIRQGRLMAQFVALEKALGAMQSQGDWLSAQLGQLNNMNSQPRNR